jgi:UDP-N-acetyl-D-glucosamine dehydrogenase
VDIWEVIEAARTKPYGFMPFYPGPGIGGHCIPLDPAYLSWRGRQFGFASRFIDIAQQINGAMPGYVVQRIGDALNESGKPLSGSRVLILGVSYKKDVSDVRESPALEIIRTLSAKNAIVSYSDPLVPQLDSLASEPLTDRMLADTDCAVIVTDHSATDYAHIVARAPLVLDTRHAINEDLRRRCSAKVVRL